MSFDALKRIFAEEDQLQAIYFFSETADKWSRTSYSQRKIQSHSLPRNLTVISWNVDFMEDCLKARLSCVLDHIQKDVLQCGTVHSTPSPSVILLQEVHSQAFSTILAHAWVRKHFAITPVSSGSWPRGAWYGNVTLVSRNAELVVSSTVAFQNSTMARFALFTDVRVAAPCNSEATEGDSEETAADIASAVVRFANVHLESLPIGAKARPEQLAIVSTKLKDASSQPDLRGGVVAGDMNAIGESDIGLPARCGLSDAYTGAEDDERGFTWGYQPPCEFPPGRLDKILYTPGGGLKVVALRRIGIGLKAQPDDQAANYTDGIWTSDHYGLAAEVQLVSAGDAHSHEGARAQCCDMGSALVCH
jgi:tyrosyl-DNA phosphodiesterase 2